MLFEGTFGTVAARAAAERCHVKKARVEKARATAPTKMNKGRLMDTDSAQAQRVFALVGAPRARMINAYLLCWSNFLSSAVA